MARIRQRWGDLINQACQYSSIPPEFLAALIANESGGNPEARRFEANVYRQLFALRAGRLAHYQGLSHEFVASADDATLLAWATSWGLTQIVGYHVAQRPGGIGLLRNPETHLKFALGLLSAFVERFQLNAKAEFEEMFRCWNTGAPYDDPKTPRVEGRTSDPQYVVRGLARMKIYQEVEPR
jgi:hypothetical protein